MDVSSQEGEIPHPISSTYGGGGGHVHMIHRDPPPPPQNHIIPSSALQLPSNGPILHAALQEEDHMPYNKKVVRYRECLKNHAAAMGGNATDGCGEFMPCGEEGTIEALKCSACNCHRNFHRKEMEGECESPYHHHINDFYHNNNNMGMGRKMIVGHHHHHHKVPLLGSEALGYPTTGTLLSSRAPPPPTHHQMIMSFNNLGGSGSLPSESDEQEGVMPRTTQLVKKRFRTKFTQEQKEKMLGFAEKVGWKMQKQEEAVVQQLCQEIGIKRRVLKVWMHNNKHNLAKKNSTSSIT